MAFVPFVETDQPTMAAFNEKFQQNYDAAMEDGTHFQAFSYVGTGKSGASSPNKLTFGFAPKFVLLFGDSTGYSFNGINKDGNCFALSPEVLTTSYAQYVGFGMYRNGNETRYGKKSADGKTIYWYAVDTSSDHAKLQFNASGVTYRGFAIG